MVVMLPERDVREILRRESGAEGRRPPSSRTKDQKMARAVSLRTQTGGDWYSPYDMLLRGAQKNLSSWREREKAKRQHASIALKKRNCKAFNAIIQS